MRAAAGLAAADEAMTIAEQVGNEALWSNAAAVGGWFLSANGHFVAYA